MRGRIERVLDWAKVRGYRAGENPARWRGHLDHLLPARAKVRKVAHLAALPIDEMPGFMMTLRGQESVAARALEFAILTAARTGEALGARWSEFDLEAKVWTVPADRMKGGREHRAPLSDDAMMILARLHMVRRSDHVFAGTRRDILSNTTLLALLRRMGVAATVHGFPRLGRRADELPA